MSDIGIDAGGVSINGGLLNTYIKKFDTPNPCVVSIGDFPDHNDGDGSCLWGDANHLYKHDKNILWIMCERIKKLEMMLLLSDQLFRNVKKYYIW